MLHIIRNSEPFHLTKIRKDSTGTIHADCGCEKISIPPAALKALQSAKSGNTIRVWQHSPAITTTLTGNIIIAPCPIAVKFGLRWADNISPGISKTKFTQPGNFGNENSIAAIVLNDAGEVTQWWLLSSFDNIEFVRE